MKGVKHEKNKNSFHDFIIFTNDKYSLLCSN